MNTIEMKDNDLKTVELYKDFLPERIFDAHVHLHGEGTIPSYYAQGSYFYKPSLTVNDYVERVAPLFPGVKKWRLNAIPMPDMQMHATKNDLRQRANEHVLEQVKNNGDHVASVYIAPRDSIYEIERLATTKGVAGLKCYSFAGNRQNLEDNDIGDFLPESAWEVANKHKKAIILHMMHIDALSDIRNIAYINKMTEKYPDAKLVLAHCARSFSSRTVVDSIFKLNGNENIWFDFAAICESAPMMSCIIKTNAKRVVWGTDFPIGIQKGKVFSFGTGFSWLTGDNIPPKTEVTYLTAESVLAFRQAAIVLNLDRAQIEDIFYNNAVRLFNLDK